MLLERSTWPLLHGCNNEAYLILMHESAQKSLNSLTMNWVPLSVIMLLGMSNWYMISLMNSTALTAVMEATDVTLIYFMNLSTATKMCVNPSFTFWNGPNRFSPHVEKGQMIGMIWSWWDDTCFWWVKSWYPSQRRTRESVSDMVVGH
jgi:hypothetical protein